MRVVHVINTLDRFGGAETNLVALVNAQRKLGLEVYVRAVRGTSTKPLADAFLECGQGDLADLAFPRRYWIGFHRLASFACWLHRERIDVVHAHLPMASVVARVCAAAAGIDATFVTEHNIAGTRRWWGRAAHRLLNRRTAALLAVSPAVAHDAVAVDRRLKGRVHVIPNCLADDWFAPPDTWRAETRAALGLGDDVRVVASVARLTPHKRHCDLVEAFGVVRERVPRAQLLIVGDGPERPALEAAIEKAGLGACVHLLGVRRDVRAIIDAADVVALSSLWEGLPMVLLEAQARARPVVATDVLGTAAAVSPGETALLVPPGEPSALAGALVALLEDPARCAEMGAHGRALAVSRYSADVVARATVALYENYEVLGKREGKARRRLRPAGEGS
jgi:glycosyltransferase involved in cell wall biosynthesis